MFACLLKPFRKKKEDNKFVHVAVGSDASRFEQINFSKQNTSKPKHTHKCKCESNNDRSYVHKKPTKRSQKKQTITREKSEKKTKNCRIIRRWTIYICGDIDLIRYTRGTYDSP